MSLINDMLRDLEKREQRQHNSSAHDHAPVVTTRRHPLKLVIVIGIVFVLLGLVWFGVGFFTVETPTELLTTTPIAPPVVPPSSGQKEVAARENNLSNIPAVVPQLEEPPLAADIFGKLLKLAIENGGNQTVLTLTFSKFPQYQLLDSGPDGEGLVVRFDHTQLGDEFKLPVAADSLVKRISFIPESDELRLLVDLDSKTRLLSSQLVETDQHDFRLQITFVAAQLAADPVAVDTVVHTAPLPVETEKKKEPLAVSPIIAKASKRAPAVARDKQAYRSGLEQLQAGQLGAAEASFVQALLVNPEFLDARLQLVDLLQQRQKFAKAEDFLQQGLSLTPDSPVLRKIYARQLLQEQRGREAIELLQAVPVPPMAHDLEYHALLAAALQGVGEYRAASSLYAQLVKLRPQEGLWWLGMAVSLEQSGHRDAARDAYQKALSLPGLCPDLQSYAQGRLQAL